MAPGAAVAFAWHSRGIIRAAVARSNGHEGASFCAGPGAAAARPAAAAGGGASARRRKAARQSMSCGFRSDWREEVVTVMDDVAINANGWVRAWEVEVVTFDFCEVSLTLTKFCSPSHLSKGPSTFRLQSMTVFTFFLPIFSTAK